MIRSAILPMSEARNCSSPLLRRPPVKRKTHGFTLIERTPRQVSRKLAT